MSPKSNKMQSRTLCPLSDQQRLFVLQLIDAHMATDPTKKLTVKLLALRRIVANRRIIPFVGAVADMDCDAWWELASTERQIRSWARRAAKTSYEIPRMYELKVILRGFGQAQRLDKSPEFRFES
jgi:hypothetical protein